MNRNFWQYWVCKREREREQDRASQILKVLAQFFKEASLIACTHASTLLFPVILSAVIKGEMKHFAIASHCVQIALVRLLPWWFLAGFTILLFLFPKGIMPYCYPAPEHFPRWCQVSTQHSPCQKSSFPALCWVHCHVTITLSDTCQHAVRQEFFTSKTAYSAPSSADFALLSACLEGMNGVERRQQAQFQAIALRGELGSSPERYLAQLELWTPAEQLWEPSTEEGRKAGGRRKGTWKPLYFLSGTGRSKAPCETPKQ